MQDSFNSYVEFKFVLAKVQEIIQNRGSAMGHIGEDLENNNDSLMGGNANRDQVKFSGEIHIGHIAGTIKREEVT
jgi:hypothetical protein